MLDASAIPAQVQLPTALVIMLVVGALATAAVAVVRIFQHFGGGLSWMRAKVTEPEREDIDQLRDDLRRVEGKVDELLAQLTSENGGSAREQINGIRAELTEHIRLSAGDRAYLHERLNGVEHKVDGVDDKLDES